MLLQEQTTDNSETSLNGVGSLASKRNTMQEIVAREDGPQTAAAKAGGVSHVSQSVEREEPDVVTETLLGEVRELRVKANQDSVMTKRKVFDRTAWVFFGGMLGVGGVAMFLVYTNYMMYFKVRQMNMELYAAEGRAALSQSQLQDMRAANTQNTTAARQMIQKWEYPHARVSAVMSGTTNWETMTTNQPFAAVCDYYRRLACAPLPHLPQSSMRATQSFGDQTTRNFGDPFTASGNDGVHSFVASGTANPNVTPHTATYARHTDTYEMTANVSEGANNTTVINLTSNPFLHNP